MRNPDSRVEQSLSPVVARWADQDRHLLLPLFPLIASGESYEAADLAGVLQRQSDAIAPEIEASLAEIDSRGRVSELFGITREPTLHRIEVGAATLYSCCALVAHMVPALLRQPVIVESTDPVNGEKLRLGISAESELQQVDPMTGHGSMVDGAVGDTVANPRGSFCCHVKHFTSNESATEFVGAGQGRYVMTIEEFHEAAQWLFEKIWAV